MISIAQSHWEGGKEGSTFFFFFWKLQFQFIGIAWKWATTSLLKMYYFVLHRSSKSNSFWNKQKKWVWQNYILLIFRLKKPLKLKKSNHQLVRTNMVQFKCKITLRLCCKHKKRQAGCSHDSFDSRIHEERERLGVIPLSVKVHADWTGWALVNKKKKIWKRC